MTYLLGIDDAGRGPVIGPMTLAGIIIKESDYPKIKALNAKDSKLLSPLQRKKIGEQLKPLFSHYIVKSSPKQIDESSNLNTLEAQKTAQIINHLIKNLKEQTKIIVDCPSVNTSAWQNEVEQILTKNYQLKTTNYSLSCEHKADRDHPIVGAASILAKEHREEEIEKIRNDLQVDFGSGYPADPKTKNFLADNFDNEAYAHIIRFSWNTIKKLFKAKASTQKKLF